MSSGSSKADSPDTGHKAQFACLSCRAQKKGCNKALPACSSCVRLNRLCRYSSGPAPASIPGDYQKLVERVAHLENEITQYRTLSDSDAVSTYTNPTSSITSTAVGSYSRSDDSAFPSSFFLDVDVFKQQRIKAHKPRGAIPDEILQAIGDDMQIRTTIGAYFFSVSTWMAMTSKRRLYQEVSNSSFGMSIDIALLVLAMKLVNEKLPRDQCPLTDLYAMTKEFYSNVKSTGIGSIRLLQSGILISLYEIGHSIYPEAYLSLGHCGRLGQAIGLHDTGRVPQLALEPESWDEMEERRRVWWAIFILDRYMNVGNPTRSLALADARRGDFLPVDDTAWEQGERVRSEPLFISSSTNIAAAPFARLGQASHLLGHVLTHVNDRACASHVRLEEARQLSRALLALCSFLQPEVSSEANKICVPMGICYSALTLLYEHCTKAGVGNNRLSEETELQEMGSTGLDALVPEVVSYAGHIQTIIPFHIDQASPLINNCLYRTAKRLIGMSNDDYFDSLSFVKETLHKLSSRWSVAGLDEYLKMLNQIEATVAVSMGTDSLNSEHEPFQDDFAPSRLLPPPT